MIGASMRQRFGVAALLTTLFAFSIVSAQASAAGGAAEPLTPVEEYARQVDQFKKSYPGLSKKIEESVKTIDEMADVAKARKEIEELRGVVGDMLGAVSDNGAVAQLGGKALSHARGKLKSLELETRFKPEERQFLLDQWRRLIAETERASGDLDSARREFAELLRNLQTREDFIDELMQIRRATDAINVIRRLTQDIREASEKLKALIGGIKPPGV